MNKTINLQEHITELVTEGRALSYQLENHFNSKLVHKLRVCIRRLRTMMDLIEEDSGLPESSRIQMRKLWKQLGKTRDFDVGIELSEKYSLDHENLKSKRSEARKKFRKKLTDDKTQKLFDELEKLSFRKAVSRIDPLPLLRSLRMRLIQTPGDAEHLHELRIVLKKIRYFREALGFDVEAFKEYQDTLGEFHDLEVFLKDHPHSLALNKAFKNKMQKSLSLGRSAVQLGLKALAEVDHQFEREMSVRAS